MILQITPNKNYPFEMKGKSVVFTFLLKYRSEMNLRISTSRQQFLYYRIRNHNNEVIVNEPIRSSTIVKIIQLVAGGYFLEIHSPINQDITGNIYFELEEFKTDIPYLEPYYEFNTHMNYDLIVEKEPEMGGEVDIPVYFEIVDGRLPPNFTMNELGQIYSIGEIMELDCMEDNAHLSPSGIWYYEDGSEAMSWGRQWKFKVRAYIKKEGYLFEPVFRWYCIRIYNNYDHERDAIVNHGFDNFYHTEVYELQRPNPEIELPASLCRLIEVKNQSLNQYNMQLYEIEEDLCNPKEEDREPINEDREVYIIPYGINFESDIPSLIQESVSRITVNSNDIEMFKNMIANSRLLKQVTSDVTDYEIISYIEDGKLIIERVERLKEPDYPDEYIDPIREYEKAKFEENHKLPFMADLSYGVHMKANFNFYKNS